MLKGKAVELDTAIWLCGMSIAREEKKKRKKNIPSPVLFYCDALFNAADSVLKSSTICFSPFLLQLFLEKAFKRHKTFSPLLNRLKTPSTYRLGQIGNYARATVVGETLTPLVEWVFSGGVSRITDESLTVTGLTVTSVVRREGSLKF